MDPKRFESSSIWVRSTSGWEIDTKFAVGWLSKIADSKAFRENNIYPKICRIEGAFADGQAGISVHFTERPRGDIPPRLTVKLGFCALKVTQRRGLRHDDL